MNSNKTLSNNIFNYATKELSQDAFIAWLLYHYNDSGHKVYPVAKKLLKKIISESKLGIDLPSNKIEIKLQEEKRDITIYFLNEDDEIKKDLVIFFEDKVNSSENNGQIKKYYEKLENTKIGVKKEKFENIIPVYFKTTYMTKEEDAHLKNIKKDLDSLVILSQEVISKFIANIDTSNYLLKDWIEYFKTIDVSNNNINLIPNIFKEIDNNHNPIFKKSLKIKILDEISFSIKNRLNLEKSSAKPFNNSKAIYGYMNINSEIYYRISMFDSNIRLSLILEAKQISKEYPKKIREKIKSSFGKNNKGWDCKNYRKTIASFNFDNKSVQLNCSYNELRKQIEDSIIKMNDIVIS